MVFFFFFPVGPNLSATFISSFEIVILILRNILFANLGNREDYILQKLVIRLSLHFKMVKILS
jgi:hypothetical protein